MPPSVHPDSMTDKGSIVNTMASTAPSTAPSTTPTINPSRRSQPPPKLKKPIPHYRHLVRTHVVPGETVTAEEKAMDKDLDTLREILDLFLNNKMAESEAMLEQGSTMYYQLGKAIVQALRALATFDPEEIAKGMKAFEATIKAADKLRKGSIIGLGSVKAVGSFVVGTIGAGSFRAMNRVQKHAELIYAEATILRSLLSVLYHVDLWMIIEECINLRHAFTIIQGLKTFMDTVESDLRAGKSIDHHRIDEHLVSGVTLSYSLYNIIISFMPDVIVKMLQFIGFPSDRDWGLGLLSACGDWDPMAGPETKEEREARHASAANDGTRRQFCDMVPIVMQLIVSSFIPLNHVDYTFAETINNYNIERYPQGPFHAYFKGRGFQVTSRIDEALTTYQSIKVEQRWHNLAHVGAFEELMCAMMLGDHETACEKSRLLLKESRWSKCCFRYLTAITTYERGIASEKKKMTTLMTKVEDGMQKIAGMNLFFETFVSRKSKRFIKEGHLLLPNLDFGILWNTYDMMPLDALRLHLDQVSNRVQQLRQLLPGAMVERERTTKLADKDQTLEAASGFFSSSKAPKDSIVKNYENFYDDYCLAHFLQGVMAYHLAFFPSEVHDRGMCRLALDSFDTVFRYAPLIKDDTYAYYFAHYYKAKIWIQQGHLDKAQTRLKYLLALSSHTVIGLPALVGGKGKNSLELFVLLKTHSALIEVETARNGSVKV